MGWRHIVSNLLHFGNHRRLRAWHFLIHISYTTFVFVSQVKSICIQLLTYLVIQFVRKWFESRSNIPWLKKIIWVIGVLRRTVVSDWRFDNLCESHLHSQVVVLVSWKFKNPGERFDWSVDRAAVGNCVMWLAVKTCAERGYANRWVVKWIINMVLLFPVE